MGLLTRVEAEYEPTGHADAWIAPLPQKLPAGQGLQSLCEVALVVLRKRPAGHGAGVVTPTLVAVQYFPSGHSLHAEMLLPLVRSL